MSKVAHYDDRPGKCPNTGGEMTRLSAEVKLISTKELSGHMSASSAWISIEGKVYDVTEFLNQHPGGKGVLLAKCGKDATDDFLRVGHSSRAQQRMMEFHIGKLDKHASHPVGTRCPAMNNWAAEGGADIGDGDLEVDLFTLGLTHATAFLGGPASTEILPMKGVKWPVLENKNRYSRFGGLVQHFLYVWLLSWASIPRCRIINLIICTMVASAVLTFAYNLITCICGQSFRATHLLLHMSRWETHWAALCSFGFLWSTVLVYDDTWGLLQSQLCAIAFFDLIVYPGSLVAARHPRPPLALRLHIPLLLFTALFVKVHLLGFMSPMRALVCAVNGFCGACYVRSRGANSKTPLQDEAIGISAALQLVVGYFFLSSSIDLSSLQGASLAQPSELISEDLWVSILYSYSTWTSLAAAIVVAYVVYNERHGFATTCKYAAGPVSVFNVRYLFPNLVVRVLSVILKTLTWKWSSLLHFGMALVQCAGVWRYQEKVMMGSYKDVQNRVLEPAELEMATGMLSWLLLLRGILAHLLSRLVTGATKFMTFIAHPETLYYFHPTPVVNFRRENVEIGIAYSVTPMDEQRKPTVFQCNVGFMDAAYDWMHTNRFTYKMLKQLSSDPHAGKKGFVSDFVAEFRKWDPVAREMSTKQVNISSWSDAKSSMDWFHASKAHKQIVQQFQSHSEGGKLDNFSALLAQLQPPPDRPLRWVVKCHECHELVHGYPECKHCPKCGSEVYMPLM